MSWVLKLKAKGLRYFFDNIVLRKQNYVLDGVPSDFHDEQRQVPTSAGELRTLLHWPSAAKGANGPLPVLVLIHGGGFVFGLPEHEAAYCRRLARNLGCLVVNPDYARAPEQRFPVAATQCYELVAWLAREAGQLGLDASRLAVGGHSAGGNLAAVIVAQAVARGFPKICYQILDYPFLDADLPPDRKARPIAKPLITPELAEFFNRCYLTEDSSPRDPLISPVFANPLDLADHPPTLLITAEQDLLREEADKYYELLRLAGVKVRREMFRGVDHAFTHIGPKDAADRAWQLMEDSLREVFFRS